MVRGPLAKGLLSGRYDETTVFTDDVRQPWNKGEAQRDFFVKNVERVAQLRDRLPAESNMIETAIRYVISNPAVSVAIPRRQVCTSGCDERRRR